MEMSLTSVIVFEQRSDGTVPPVSAKELRMTFRRAASIRAPWVRLGIWGKREFLERGCHPKNSIFEVIAPTMAYAAQARNVVLEAKVSVNSHRNTESARFDSLVQFHSSRLI